jgi:hypothetical protein
MHLAPFFCANNVIQLEYSIYIGTIAVTLLNFGSRPTMTAFLMAALYTIIAILCLGYSMGIYLYRSQAIRTRRAARYHDKWGPSVLCIALLVAVILNFGLELRERGMV